VINITYVMLNAWSCYVLPFKGTEQLLLWFWCNWSYDIIAFCMIVAFR